MTTATLSAIRVVCDCGRFLGEWPMDLPFPQGYRPRCDACHRLTTPRFGGTISK
jgi:hypothetical protein